MINVIEVKNLVKIYRGTKIPAVNGVSFSVKAGEFFSLLGPNGAGKTTTISILTTLKNRTSGATKVAGFDTQTQSGEVRQRIGIIFQNPSLDQNLTAEENIRFHTILYGLFSYRPTFALMPDEYKHQVEKLSEVLGLSLAELSQPVKTLSGGMKRKLEIIRSLMHKPKILFLDEPTSGLDPLSRRSLWQYLNEVRAKEKTTIFLTPHSLEEAEGSDSVCIINHGQVVAFGTPTHIKRKFAGEHTSLEAAYLNIVAQTQ